MTDPIGPRCVFPLEAGWLERFVLVGLGLLAGCESVPPQPQAPVKLAARHFGALKPWATPIEDYLLVGEAVRPEGFRRAITELMPFGGRLYLGYGDADYNLGEHTPIEMRAFSAIDDPIATPRLVHAEGQGAPQTSPYQSGEEQIDRYRVIDGTLWQAGIDSTDPDELWTQANTTPKGIQGNVYRLEGDAFLKFRSVRGGEHIHDLAGWMGEVYAVGSGADLRTEFEAGEIFRYLWRSSDRQSFATVERVSHSKPGTGDTRFVHLLPLAQHLYLFGYETTFATGAGVIMNAAYDGQTLVPLARTEPLASVFPDGTLALPGGTGIVYGIDLASGQARRAAYTVASDGSILPLATLAGTTVVDAQLTERGELIYLTVAGEALEEQPPTSWDARILVADVGTPDLTTELLHFTTEVAPVSVAVWNDSLFLGTAAGAVLRADAP